MDINVENPKIKYLIEIFRSLPEFPTQEDFRYLINKWYYLEGGKNHIHDWQKIEETGNLIFSDKILIEKIGDKDKTESLLNQLLEEKKIKLFKETKFTKYYEIVETN